MSSNNIMLLNRNFHDINPITCGWERCAPRHSFGPAQRDYFLLHYVVEGNGRFCRDGREFVVYPGQIFVIRPGETTYYEADAHTPWYYRWVGFCACVPLPESIQYDIIQAPECGHLFAAMDAANSMGAGRESYICGLLWQLLAAFSEKQATRSLAEEYVLRAKNYIESAYLNDITVEKMARFLNLDRCYFSTLFKKHTGRSPQQYLVEFRLHKAAALLTDGYSPGEAAIGCGYRDTTNFSRMFSRYFGVAPSHYRKVRNLPDVHKESRFSLSVSHTFE